MDYFEDNSLSIGVTPLVKLNRVVRSDRTLVLAKIEGRKLKIGNLEKMGIQFYWEFP